MTDPTANGNRKPRRLLAPHPWPLWDGPGGDDGGGPVFYLSWPGWELFLSRRLGLAPVPGGPAPLLLPDAVSPERDFAAIDQLLRQAETLGAAVLSLDRRIPESVPALAGALRDYRPDPGQPTETVAPQPILDDRSYLALWAATEYLARQSRDLLAEAAAREQAMWAALKGEEPEPALPSPPPDGEPDRRAAYAWRCWRRLAAPLIRPADIIVPTAPAAD